MAVQLGKYTKNGLSVNFIVYKLYQVKKTNDSLPTPPKKAFIFRKYKIFRPQKKKTKKQNKTNLLLKLYNSFG